MAKIFRMLLLTAMLICRAISLLAQDSAVRYITRTVTLDEIVIRASRYDFNVEGFIKRVEADTSFYKAFKTLRILGYTASHDIRVMDPEGKLKASWTGRTVQEVHGGCRHNIFLQQNATGNFYTRKGKYRYYTAQMYGSLFLTHDTICGDDNIVQGGKDDIKGAGASVEKHIRQLEVLVFNPGKPVPGVPFVGKEVAIFNPSIAPRYDFSITSGNYKGIGCWIFAARCKPAFEGQTVIKNLTTYFDTTDYKIVYRTYSLYYSNWLFDFNVQMEVRMTRFEGQTVPEEIRYQGNWGVPIHKRERVNFDIMLSAFNAGD
jgi:hypothetical protein